MRRIVKQGRFAYWCTMSFFFPFLVVFHGELMKQLLQISDRVSHTRGLRHYDHFQPDGLCSGKVSGFPSSLSHLFLLCPT